MTSRDYFLAVAAFTVHSGSMEPSAASGRSVFRGTSIPEEGIRQHDVERLYTLYLRLALKEDFPSLVSRARTLPAGELERTVRRLKRRGGYGQFLSDVLSVAAPPDDRTSGETVTSVGGGYGLSLIDPDGEAPAQI